MTAKELRELSVNELELKLKELKEELFNLRFQLAINQLENPMRIQAVKKVNTLNVRGKLRRQGRYEGYTRCWKKAVVTLTEDSKPIEFFEGMM